MCRRRCAGWLLEGEGLVVVLIAFEDELEGAVAEQVDADHVFQVALGVLGVLAGGEVVEHVGQPDVLFLDLIV